MPGHSTMRMVKVWLQTSQPTAVQIEYKAQDDSMDSWQQSEIIQTQNKFENVALFELDTEPGITYTYRVLLDGVPADIENQLNFKSQTLWQYRTDPPAFTFGLGSCTYINETPYERPGKLYGANLDIFSIMNNEPMDFFLWMGDNIYLREVDYDSKAGILKRYNHMKQQPELQAFFQGRHHYAIWDDHDFGPNDSDRSYILKEDALDAFELFWANPGYGLTNERDGICSNFKWNDCEFFLLDNRYFRSPNKRKNTDHTILGTEQLEWLLDALSYSNSSFKFVVIGGQVLNTAAVFENYANTHAEERAYLIESIQQEGIKNVIFLNGDRHHTELSMLDKEGSPVIYDFTVSPLTSAAYDALDEPNDNRVKGTHVADHNYGLIEVSGSFRARTLKFIINDKTGQLLWEHSIQQQ
jgi:alkaline phosphatase D